jgi:hypothetical protein
MKNLYFQQIYQCSAELLDSLEENSGIPLEEDSNTEKYCVQYFGGGSKYKKALDEHLANLNDEFRVAKSKLIVFICKEHEEDLFTWYLVSYSPDGLSELMKSFLEVFPALCDKVSPRVEMVACDSLSQWSKIKALTRETTQVPSEGQFRYYCSVLDVIKIKNGEYICGKYLITSYISDVKPEDRYLEAAEGNDDRRVLSSEWFIQPVVDNQEEDGDEEKEEKKTVAAGKRLRSKSGPEYLYSVYSDFSHDEDVGYWATNIDKHSLKEYQTVLQEVFTYEENYGDSDFYLYYMHVN